MTTQIPDDLARGLEGVAAAQHKRVEQVALAQSPLSPSTERLRLKPYCEPFRNYLIQALRLSMISRRFLNKRVTGRAPVEPSLEPGKDADRVDYEDYH